MSEKRYYWLKLMDDFFTSKRIKRLRSLAGGDTYTIIYLKMQLKALKTDGYLYFDGVMESFAEELALDIDEKPDDVKVTISYLLSVGLLETNGESEYCLTYMQNLIGSENSSAQRVRDFRNRKKEEALQCNDNVTDLKRVGNVDIDIEKEKDIEIDKDICRIKIPLEDGTEYEIEKDFYSECLKAYPKVNVDEELSKMRCWCMANEKNKKTRKGIKRFINSWLSRAKQTETKQNIQKSKYDFAAMERFLNE